MSKQKFSTAAVDRIGSLPEEILIHILSFFPTKQAVATSILSKRWIHLWLYVPVLKFTKTKWKDQKSYSRFKELVFSILRSREAVGNHSINTFILDPQYCYTDTPIPKLPISNLTCTTLKTIHLKNIYFDQLSNVDFLRWMLLDGCPVLEDLQLSNINFFKCYTHHYFDDFENKSMLRKLNSADITDCECYFPVYQPYDFPTFNNLTRLVINYDWDIVVQVLHHCRKLQNLELYQDVYRTRDYIQNWVDPKSVPSCLSLNLTTCTMRDLALAGQQRNHIILARFVLENARVLETMSIWYRSKYFKVDLRRVLSSCPRASSACQLLMYRC